MCQTENNLKDLLKEQPTQTLEDMIEQNNKLNRRAAALGISLCAVLYLAYQLIRFLL